ncbi:MAG: mannitol-1-phosphate 5-dehydrogenase [Anaerolineae bacterium]|nr:mannitol-1-phosphate 5-dehydrogenase [Anaerolineae bacterium]
MKKAIMFGAGNIGRGFIGQLLSESDYEVIFIDIDQRVIDQLNHEHSYILREVDNNGETNITVGPVSAIHSSDRDAVARIFCESAIGATAVGARVLPMIAPLVALGVRARKQSGIDTPLNLIICENLNGAAAHFHDLVEQQLETEDRDYFNAFIGMVDTVIGRMVPPLSPYMREQDPTLILVEPYKHLPVARAMFKGEIPAISSMEPKIHFEAYTAMKLFIHNCGHAALSYLGYLAGYTFGYEALSDATIFSVVRGVMDESMTAISAIYGEERAILAAMVDDLLERFRNRALGDTIFRLGRDPIRKLAPNDRLVGAARLVEQAGGVPRMLAKAIAAGYCFDPEDDPIAGELQACIRQDGFAKILSDVSGIDVEEPLGIEVFREYERLHR